MADILTHEQRHINMSAIRSTSTKPELKLRHALWHLGFRYRVNDKKLPGKPDIVLPKYHTVIFIHGCFWHGHKGCKHYTVPKTNTEFWTEKVARNQERDQDVWRRLEAMGWFVIIVWECQLKKAVFDSTVERVAAEIVQNGERYRADKAKRKAARAAYQTSRKALKAKESTFHDEIKAIVNN